MAISTKKKNLIIAMWKTGKYKSYTSIAKHYKISTKTAQKIIGSNTHSNEDIVEMGVVYESAKKSIKNPHEITTIERAVEERTEMDILREDLQLNNLKISKLAQAKIIQNKDDIDLTNIKAVTGAIKDIEAVANPQTSKTDVTVNNQNNNSLVSQNKIELEFL